MLYMLHTLNIVQIYESCAQKSRKLKGLDLGSWMSYHGGVCWSTCAHGGIVPTLYTKNLQK